MSAPTTPVAANTDAQRQRTVPARAWLTRLVAALNATAAEGRLVLCDAITWVQKTHTPTMVIRLEHSLLLRLDRGRLHINSHASTQMLEAGDAIAFSAFSAWSIEAEDDFDATWVGVPAWWLHQRVLTMGLPAFVAPIRTGTMTAQLLDIAIAGVMDESTDQTSLPVETFCDLLARWLVASPGSASLSRRGRIDLILEYIVANYPNENVTPKGAADAIGCSVRSIHQACAEQGTTFGSLLLYTRVSIAAYKLSYQSARIAPVAFECGFTSLSHFSHAFKAQYGVTAREFRSRYRSTAKA